MALAYPETCPCLLSAEHKKFREEQDKAFKRAAPRRSGRPSLKWNGAKDVPNGKAADFILISGG
jgi:hypothetical protein